MNVKHPYNSQGIGAGHPLHIHGTQGAGIGQAPQMPYGSHGSGPPVGQPLQAEWYSVLRAIMQYIPVMENLRKATAMIERLETYKSVVENKLCAEGVPKIYCIDETGDIPLTCARFLAANHEIMGFMRKSIYSGSLARIFPYLPLMRYVEFSVSRGSAKTISEVSEFYVADVSRYVDLTEGAKVVWPFVACGLRRLDIAKKQAGNEGTVFVVKGVKGWEFNDGDSIIVLPMFTSFDVRKIEFKGVLFIHLQATSVVLPPTPHPEVIVKAYYKAFIDLEYLSRGCMEELERQQRTKIVQSQLALMETMGLDYTHLQFTDDLQREYNPALDYISPLTLTRDQLSSVDPVRYKTKMCVNWKRFNRCPYRTQCLFAHGLQEIRSHESNWFLLENEKKSCILKQYESGVHCRGGTPYPMMRFEEDSDGESRTVKFLQPLGPPRGSQSVLNDSRSPPQANPTLTSLQAAAQAVEAVRAAHAGQAWQARDKPQHLADGPVQSQQQTLLQMKQFQQLMPTSGFNVPLGLLGKSAPTVPGGSAMGALGLAGMGKGLSGITAGPLSGSGQQGLAGGLLATPALGFSLPVQHSRRGRE